MVGGLVDTLTAALDEFAELDLDTLEDAALHDAVVALGESVDPLGGGVVSADRALGRPPGVGW